ncbi:conjugal transfer protein [Salicibibacter cibarius]|uniref:SHOCT-like domain-containing protein n=2 Tax=Bacillaceae TaxID=186817 RepID=A0A1G8Q0W5_9BACI|nr:MULTISPECIES: SHOCT domain-containing protein [Bacillaceae]QQK75440.1 conjugal transfer protein [Salicibibacter cibarius]SDI98384.1 hypothetical protein SAMN04488123_11052 [Natribacillus halophilus]
MDKTLLKYSMKIAMLKQLLALSLITEKEFILVKNHLMEKYGIISEVNF